MNCKTVLLDKTSPNIRFCFLKKESMTAGLYIKDFDIANEQTDARTNKRTDHIY